jgi:hypothetical protein
VRRSEYHKSESDMKARTTARAIQELLDFPLVAYATGELVVTLVATANPVVASKSSKSHPSDIFEQHVHVWYSEPVPANHSLEALPDNCLLTPSMVNFSHISFSSPRFVKLADTRRAVGAQLEHQSVCIPISRSDQEKVGNFFSGGSLQVL